MNTPRSEIDLDLPFAFKILRIKLNLMLLLLSLYLDKDWIAKIVVVQVKYRLIVPAVIRCNSLPIRDSRILDQHFGIDTRRPIGAAHKPFNRISMVCSMICLQDGWMRNEGTDTGCGHYQFQPETRRLSLFPLHSPVPIPAYLRFT